MYLFLVYSYGDWCSDPKWTSFLRLNSTRNGSFGTSSGPLQPYTSLGSADKFGEVSPGSRISHIGWDSEFYMAVKQITCPLPVGKILGWGCVWVKHLGHTHSWSRHEWDSAERYWEIPTQAKDTGWGMAERCQGNYPSRGKVLGGWGLTGKKSRDTQGPTERCQGHSIVGDWIVLAEWLSKKLIWHFSSIWSRDITLPTKVLLVKAMVFPVVMYGCDSWPVKKAEHWRIDTFELWCWRRLLRVPWTARRSNQSILKEISPGYSLEGMMLKLKIQYFGHLMRRVDSLEKALMLGGIRGRRRRGWQRMIWLEGITD